MKKFIVIYYVPAEASMHTNEISPERQANGMEAWMTWAKKCSDNLVDMRGSNTSSKGVTGYSVLQAKDMEAAKALLQGHPYLGWSEACSIKLHETMTMPGI